jgi:hypothetical protein
MEGPAEGMVPLFDLKTRSVPRDSTGLIKRVHWVDQAVALALGVTNGTLSSQVGLGNALRFIRRNDFQRIIAEVTDAVRICLLDLISRRDILVTDVQVTTPVRSQIVVAVYYINLRTSDPGSIPDNIAFTF